MTPPKPTKSDLSFLDWAPGKDQAPANTPNCSNCHDTPKSPTPLSKNIPNNPFFLDYTRKSRSVLDPQSAADLRAWLEQGLPPEKNVSSPIAKKTAVPELVPSAPGDAISLKGQAEELERQARLALDPEKKAAFYQGALSFRLLAGDARAAQATLDLLDSIYKKSKHEAGQNFVAATRLWFQGKTQESLKALSEMSSVAQSSGSTFYRQFQAQRSLMLQNLAGETLKGVDYENAKSLLIQALQITPSDALRARVLKLMAKHGDAGLLEQSLNLSALQEKREKLIAPPPVCNTGCHGSNGDAVNLGNFEDYAPLLKGLSDKPLRKGPDLSPYRHLRHLTHQQKLMLHELDAEIQIAQKKYHDSQAAVSKILFLKTLDQPKEDIGVLEEKMLKSASAFEAPDRSLPYFLSGEAYLAKKDFEKAEIALSAAVRLDPSHVDALFSLGAARFATGDFKASRDAYTSLLEQQSQDVVALRYRADANAHYLATLDSKTRAGEIRTVEDEMTSDRALLLALSSNAEKDKLNSLEKQLEKLHEGESVPVQTRQETLAMMELMAKQYLALAETKQSGVQNSELVRKELNGLAQKAFELLGKFAKADSDPQIKRRSGLYEGYALLAQGKIDEATKVLEPFRKDIPEIEKILGTLEKNKLRMVNLAALDAWSVYNKEGSAIQSDAQSGLLGKAIGGIEGWFRSDGKDFRDDTKAHWKSEVAFVAELKSRIESGKADTILQAMQLIEKDGPESMKAEAKYYINYNDSLITGYPLGALVHLVDKLPPEKGEAETLLRKTWDLERQNPALETPYAFYTLVNFLEPTACFNGTPREHMDALEGHGSFGRSAFKFITSMSPESLAADVLLMAASAGLGNLAKLSALSKLEKAGVTGYKAVFLAGAAGVGVETTALWAANLGKESLTRDPSKIFTQEHMLKSYGATLIMIGGLKGAGALGESMAPRAAKSLGLVTEGGTKLTAGGKVLSWTIGHGTGLSGMIATSQVSQGLGLAPKPIGGWKEGLVHDVFGYLQFAIAHKVADRALSGKLSSVSQKQHSEIAVREAILTAKSYADALGFRATRNAKGEIIDSPERKLIIGLLVDSSLNKVGFSGSKLAKLVESRHYEKANEYFAEFGLPLEYTKSGQLFAVARGEASPHAAAGIPAGKPKPAAKPLATDLYLKQLGEKAAELMDKAAEWLFGPPGGGFGGMQPAFAGAYGAAKAASKPKESPKLPDHVMMADGSGWSGGHNKSLEKFETALLEKDIFDIEHNGNEGKNPDSVKLGLQKKAELNEVASALRGELPAELKNVEIILQGPASLNDLAALLQVAREKNLDLTIYDKSAHGEAAYQFIGKRFVCSNDAGIRHLIEDALRSGQNIEIAQSKNGKTSARIEGDKVEINFKTKDKGFQIEMLEGILSESIRGSRNLTLEWGGQSFTVTKNAGKVELKGSAGEVLVYTPAKGSHRGKLNIKLPKDANPDHAALMLRIAAEFDVAKLQGTHVLVEGLDISLGGAVKGNLSGLIQKSLWGGVESLQIGNGKDIFLERATSGSTLAYNFTSKLSFEQGYSYLAEHLAFESAKVLGATGASDPQTILMQRYYRAGMRHASEMFIYADISKRREHLRYISPNYEKIWTDITQKMVDFSKSPKQGRQLNDILVKLENYSQLESNNFLEFKPFDGRSFADNAFELSRIFDAAQADSSIPLPKVLRDVASVFGTEGKVEIYGAGVGMVYKTDILRDLAAKNEFDRFQTMKDEAVYSGDAFRFTIVPEDRLQGAAYGTDNFTKTPEWVVEKLDGTGRPEKMLTVEVTNMDGNFANPFTVSDTVAKKVFQITGHKFNPSFNQGDGLIAFRFYNAAGREADLTKMVMDGLHTEYMQSSSKARSKEKIRVLLILEDPSFPGQAKAKWLEYGSGGEWKERSAAGATDSSSSAWLQPFYQAVGW